MKKNDEPRNAEASAGQYAMELFGGLQKSIIGHEAEVLNGDIEAIHDMRVGIRRLRVAMSNFRSCLPKEDRVRLAGSLKSLADALGMVRDLDVLIASLQKELKSRPNNERAAIKSLIGRLKSRRRRNMRKLTVYIQGEQYSNLKREFSAELPEQELQTGIQESHG